MKLKAETTQAFTLSMNFLKMASPFVSMKGQVELLVLVLTLWFYNLMTGINSILNKFLTN